MTRLSFIALLIAGCAASPATAPTVSSTIALTSDDRQLWVVNPDADSVSVIDPIGRALIAEIALAPPPALDPITGRFDPSVRPRALALVGDRKVYVAGQTANKVYVIDAATRMVTRTIDVAAEPTAVVATPDGQTVYVVSHEAALVTRIDPGSDEVTATLSVDEHPWGAAMSVDGHTLYVTHLLLGAGLSVIATEDFFVRDRVVLAEQPLGADKRSPSGLARGVYAVAARPGAGDLWLPHLLLAVKTAEPDLDFESTVFPTVSTVAADGSSESKRLLFKPLAVAGAGGSFTDVVSGPRAIAFTPDGKLALAAMAASEDVMVFDGETGDEVALVRPLPGSLLEGIAVDHTGRRAFVDGRGSHDVTVLALAPGDPIAPATVDGAPIERLTADPMPADLRLGQRLFFTANSAAFPITKNFWVACASCHIEGGSDAVTWRFTVGPRDTPSNAGGPINTGFLLRQGLRRSVVEYDDTIDVEQGGQFHRGLVAQAPLLDALAAFVNRGIPLPQNPYRPTPGGGQLTDGQERGRAVFNAQCETCHTGAWFTDSGAGNPTLDFAKPILLHDVGTCVKGGDFPDRPAPDESGHLHTACDFDTPSLRGVFATAPYFHDGSAPTIADVIDRLPAAKALTPDEKRDLADYVLTL